MNFAFATIPITTENCWLVEQQKRQTFHYMIFENMNEQKLYHYYILFSIKDHDFLQTTIIYSKIIILSK